MCSREGRREKREDLPWYCRESSGGRVEGSERAESDFSSVKS